VRWPSSNAPTRHSGPARANQMIHMSAERTIRAGASGP
jgi:hypothetical protein